jgi:cytoskeletal protein CcmA (bactofilin family)
MRTLLPAVLALALLPAWLPGRAQERSDRVERTLGADRFAAGGTLQLGGQTSGDLVAAAGELDLEGVVGGDALAAGGRLGMRASIAQDLYAAGGRVWMSGSTGRNARIAGGYVELVPQARIAGNATVAGGDVRIRGAVDGYLQVAGGHVVLDGAVRGNVEAAAGELELGPNARIEGTLRYVSRAELRRDPAAQVRAVQRLEMKRIPEDAGERAGRALLWIWTAGLLVLAAVFAAALPGLSAGIAATVRARWARSLLVGFVALVCIPVAALLAAVTVVGLPLALATGALYLALLLLGYVACGVSAGTLLVGQGRASHGGWRIAAAVGGMLAISLLARIPYAGAFFVLAALFLGLGALLIQLKRAMRP